MSQKTAWIIVAILLLIILLVGMGGVLYIQKRTPTPGAPVSVQSVEPTDAPVEVPLSFTTTPSVSRVGQATQFTLTVAPSASAFAISTIELIYNPQDVTVSSVAKGNMWSDSLVVENKVDNVGGAARYTLARDKSATATGNYNVVTFTLVPKRIGSIPITLGDGTLFVESSSSGPMKFSPNVFEFTVE